jgi:hypothetical protein
MKNGVAFCSAEARHEVGDAARNGLEAQGSKRQKRGGKVAQSWDRPETPATKNARLRHAAQRRGGSLLLQ